MQITPFTIGVPQAEVDDLVARIANTRWPSDVVDDWSRGVPVSYARKLADHWANAFDWPAQQALLNTFPQFTTSIDGQTIHFVHVRSSVEGATPLLLLHGYPSSFVEFSRMIGPLVDPAAYGARPEDGFHVVIPSPPGFGFSAPVSSPGWDIKQTATTFDEIMTALGYERYGVHGGDVGAGLAEQLCIQAGDRVIGSLVVTDPGAIATEFTPPTDHLTEEERDRLQGLKATRAEDFGYLQVQMTRPQSIAYGLTDSPVMQLTWIVEKVKEWTDPRRNCPRTRSTSTSCSRSSASTGSAGAVQGPRTSCTKPRMPRRPGARSTTGLRASSPSVSSRSSVGSSILRRSSPTGTSIRSAATSRRWRRRTSS
jgi:pimeloyl-ACP methyl ester carboxylesterase